MVDTMVDYIIKYRVASLRHIMNSQEFSVWRPVGNASFYRYWHGRTGFQKTCSRFCINGLA
jgi:hypothetical protein